MVLDPYLSDYRKTETLAVIKEAAPELPVIIYSGESLLDDDCSYFLADAFLTKSSDISPLLRTVDRLLIPQPKQDTLAAWAF